VQCLPKWTGSSPSYSHGGRYYTLDEVARFDELGLWSYRSVWFSRHGTLLATLEALVSAADAGCFAKELKECLHVEVKASLLRLVNDGHIARDKISGLYLYCSSDVDMRRRQLELRRTHESGVGTPGKDTDRTALTHPRHHSLR
jgi:hypothetical protein